MNYSDNSKSHWWTEVAFRMTGSKRLAFGPHTGTARKLRQRPGHTDALRVLELFRDFTVGSLNTLILTANLSQYG